MSHKFKDINIKSHRYEFFDNIINIKHFDPNNIKINRKLYKDSKYVKINSVFSLFSAKWMNTLMKLIKISVQC